jgi:8-oxo-dGTP pyrophosphatase MutT (NUDIX family)
MEYSAAGVLFTNGRVALAGYHPYKGQISGLGGKRIPEDETPFETAFREVLEELFGVDPVPPSLMKELRDVFFFPDTILCDNIYINYVYSFEALTHLLHICKKYEITCPFYTIFPETVQDLLLKRIPTDGVEITHLALVPVLTVVPTLDPFFQKDLEKIM